MASTYKSVQEMVAKNSKSKAFARKVNRNIDDHVISKFLSTIRTQSGRTESAMAKLLGVNAKKIRQLEASDNKDITLDILINYARSLGIRIALGYEDKNVTLVDQIKQTFFRLSSLLDRLVGLAGPDDEEINRGLKSFYKEVSINFLELLSRKSSALILKTGDENSIVRIEKVESKFLKTKRTTQKSSRHIVS